MSIVLLGSTSGSVTLQEPAVAGSTVIDLPATSGTMAVTSGSPSFTNITATGTLTVNGNTTLGDASTDTILMTGAPSIGGAGLGMGMGFRNRIINGAMVIDQRNAGASVSIVDALATYTTDRWQVFENGSMSFTAQQVSTAPTGFVKSLLVTSTAAVTPAAANRSALTQVIEGFNIADLGWGSASAATVTLSFWVRSSLTGQFGGALQNANQDYSYPFSFTISSANTFEFKTITVAGPTTGAWNTDNTGGVRLSFDLGMGSDLLGTAGAWTAADKRGATGDTRINGTNGATFYITGVQLEKGSTATSFDYRPYGTELVLCERYYQRISGIVCGTGTGANDAGASVMFKTEMRSSPSVGLTAALQVTRFGTADFTQSSASVSISLSGARVNSLGVNLNFGNFSGLPSDTALPQIVTGGILTLSAEL